MIRRRRLSEEEEALWTGVARSITPLRRSGEPIASPYPAARGEPAQAPASPAMREHVPRENKMPPLTPLGRRLKQRVARGRELLDDRIDLHGLTQSEAHAALLRFLRGAQENGARIVLVVTGKGTGSGRESAAARGVLRRQVPLWLALPDFRPLVVGFEDAHAGHGGEGALYVRLRRRR